MRPINLTTVTSRPLHAVQFTPAAGERMLAALAAALDGSGPAIMPLDPTLPDPAIARIAGSFDHAAVRDDTAVVICTSGSTGEPKAVELSAGALIASATASLRRIGAGPGERWLCCLPTFHIAGIGVLVRSLIAGLEPVIVPAVSPEVLAASGCAHISLVPTQLRRLLDSGAGPGTIKTVLLGGAAPSDGLLAEARKAGWRVVTTYGMTETCGGCVYDGVPLDEVSVRLGADPGQPGSAPSGPVPSESGPSKPGPSESGRIEITGPVLFSGYLGRPDLTAAALAGGWFRTADLGRWRTDGSLGVRGRADGLINTGGEKVVPGEVEAALRTCDGVADVVIIGLPDPDWGEAVTAFVVASDPADPPELEDLRSHVRQAVSVYAAPKRVVVVPEFPLLPSGKPDRMALRQIGMRRTGTQGA
jgi:o-succinylbenzoate---CoA ligase